MKASMLHQENQFRPIETKDLRNSNFCVSQKQSTYGENKRTASPSRNLNTTWAGAETQRLASSSGHRIS
jgi:hypothetical protein